MLLEWFGIGIGSACYLWAWRFWAGKLAWAEKASFQKTPDGADILWGIIVGFGAAALSPVLIPWQWLRDRDHSTFHSLILYRVLHVPKDQRK